MDAPAKPSLLQRVIDAWRPGAPASGEAELDAADLGTAFGLDYCLTPPEPLGDDEGRS